MSLRKHRLRIERTMIKAHATTVMVKIISARRIMILVEFIDNFFKNSPIHTNLHGHLTLAQLHRLIRACQLQQRRILTPSRWQSATDSRDFMVQIASDGGHVHLEFIQIVTGKEEENKGVMLELTAPVFQRFTANLQRERSSAARETRMRMG